MNQNAFVYAGLIDNAERAELTLAARRKGYVHIARGSIKVNGQQLGAGYAMKIDDGTIPLDSGKEAEVLVFDLPGD